MGPSSRMTIKVNFIVISEFFDEFLFSAHWNVETFRYMSHGIFARCTDIDHTFFRPQAAQYAVQVYH